MKNTRKWENCVLTTYIYECISHLNPLPCILPGMRKAVLTNPQLYNYFTLTPCNQKSFIPDFSSTQ